jgi:hypothetical protein
LCWDERNQTQPKSKNQPSFNSSVGPVVPVHSTLPIDFWLGLVRFGRFEHIGIDAVFIVGRFN